MKTVTAALMGLFALAGAHAQSAYTLTTLKPPLGVYFVGTSYGWAIDANDNAFGMSLSVPLAGILSFMQGYSVAPPLHLTQWRASTASSQSGTKLYTYKADINSVYNTVAESSPNGNKVVISLPKQVFDVPSRGFDPAFPFAGTPLDVNDAGDVLFDGLKRRTAAGVVQSLPFAPYVFGWGHAINNAGDVGGYVRTSEGLTQAAVWQGTALKLVAPDAAQSSQVIDLNQAGQVLVVSGPVTGCVAGQANSCQLTSERSYSVWHEGAFTPVVPEAGRRIVWAQHLSGSGVVTGVTEATTGDAPYNTRRAFIWRDGQYADLTKLVKSKGVRLPSGAVLNSIWAINDKGSMVAELKSSSGLVTAVRLTAKP
jgi:hypothetical protein